MTMLGRRRRDKRAKEAAADEEATATETEAAETEAAETGSAEAESVEAEDVEAEDAADEVADTEDSEDTGDVAGEDLIDEDLADEDVDQDELDEAEAAAREAEAEAAEAAEQARRKRAAAERAKTRKPASRVVKVARTARAEPDEDAEEPAGSRRGAVLVLAVLSVVAIALTATVVLLWSWQKDLNAKESAAKDGLNAATSAAQDFSSYDYRTLESNFKTSANAATGTFRQQYMDMMSRVRESATQQQIVVVGTVLKAGVEQVGAKQVVAVVFLNQETSRLNQQRGTDQYRLRLTVDKVKDRWLVSKVEAL